MQVRVLSAIPLDHMSKPYTIDQLKTFVNNFAKCFFPDAHIVFKVENTKLKNKFYLYFIDKRKKVNIVSLSKSYSYDGRILVSLDSHFKKINPLMMLRNGIIISIEDLIQKFNLDENVIYKQIANALKKQIENSYSNPKYSFSFKENGYASNEKHIVSFNANSFEEFMVQVDLGIK